MYSSPTVVRIFQYFPEAADWLAATVEMSSRKTDAVFARASLCAPVPAEVVPLLAYVTTPVATAAVVSSPISARRRPNCRPSNRRSGIATTTPVAPLVVTAAPSVATAASTSASTLANARSDSGST